MIQVRLGILPTDSEMRLKNNVKQKMLSWIEHLLF